MIAFIDCFTQSPVNHCVNSFTEQTGIPSTYHIASKFGVSSLNALKKPTAYIILGSASHVTENLAWHQELKDFIIPRIEDGVPTLGICFGHQLIAHHYGCEVGYYGTDQDKKTEARELTVTNNFFNYKKDQKIRLGYAHSQIIKTVTSDFLTLASSDLFEHEIIKHKDFNYFSLQAHPESSESFLMNDANVTEISEVKLVLNDGLKFLKEFYDFSNSVLK